MISRACIQSRLWGIAARAQPHANELQSTNPDLCPATLPILSTKEALGTGVVPANHDVAIMQNKSLLSKFPTQKVQVLQSFD